jgi:hypothetical protein
MSRSAQIKLRKQQRCTQCNIKNTRGTEVLVGFSAAAQQAARPAR